MRARRSCTVLRGDIFIAAVNKISYSCSELLQSPSGPKLQQCTLYYILYCWASSEGVAVGRSARRRRRVHDRACARGKKAVPST